MASSIDRSRGRPPPPIAPPPPFILLFSLSSSLPRCLLLRSSLAASSLSLPALPRSLRPPPLPPAHPSCGRNELQHSKRPSEEQGGGSSGKEGKRARREGTGTEGWVWEERRREERGREGTGEGK
eukprot:673517-Hanusia_phi.AAC.1